MTRPRGFSSRIRSGLGILAAGYVKAVYRTGRFSNSPENSKEYSASLGPVIVASWHGQNMILPPFWHQQHPLTILVSRHKDADVAATAYERLGLHTIRGSGSAPGKMRASKGGAGALRQMVRALNQGSSVGITADMPPGPARRAGRGIIMLAQMSGKPIMPLAVTTKNRYVVANWCRYAFNLPFSKGSIAVGEPIIVPRDADEALTEAKRLELEDVLNALTVKADELAGRSRHYDTGGSAPALPLSYTLYKAATYLLNPLAPLWLKYRVSHGKETSDRLSERRGVASLPRKSGQLIWFHAASVGESLSCLELITRLLEARKDLRIVVTTATISAAEILETRLPTRAIHQFAPLDFPGSITRFLDHWRPDMAVFVESEIWPNTIANLYKRGIPISLVNARLSRRSFKRWHLTYGFIRALLSRFSHIAAQSPEAEQRLAALGARSTVYVGNMKADTPVVVPSPRDSTILKIQIGTRPVWLAASTHAGEEQIILECHTALAAKFPRLLTLIVPRHRERAGDIGTLIADKGLNVAKRSMRQAITKETDIYLADTLGELALFYELAPVSFIGGSLVPVGGHNPLEAITGDTAIIYGPYVDNFRDIYADLEQLSVANGAELTHAVEQLLNDRDKTAQMIATGNVQATILKGASEKTKTALLALLDDQKGGLDART